MPSDARKEEVETERKGKRTAARQSGLVPLWSKTLRVSGGPFVFSSPH